MKKKWLIKVSLAILILFFLIFIIRLVSPVEIDDVTPGIPCEQKYLEKSDVLWIIPNFQDSPIVENQTWCNEILKLNKTLGLHGYKHTYQEFGNETISQEDLKKAIFLFEICFEQTPTMFKPPQLEMREQNKKMIKDSGLKIKTRFNQVIHKVYHCNDTSEFLKNSFIDLI